MLDSDFGLDCLLALYKCLGARVFEVDVLLVLCPQFKDVALFQSLLTNLGVVLSDELITQVNESIEGHASVEENDVVEGHAAMGRHVSVVEHAAVEKNIVVRDDDSDEDALLSDCSDIRLSSDDDLYVNFMQADLDRAVDEATDRATERLKSSHLETDSDDNLSDVDKEVKM